MHSISAFDQPQKPQVAFDQTYDSQKLYESVLSAALAMPYMPSNTNKDIDVVVVLE